MSYSHELDYWAHPVMINSLDTSTETLLYHALTYQIYLAKLSKFKNACYLLYKCLMKFESYLANNNKNNKSNTATIEK